MMRHSESVMLLMLLAGCASVSAPPQLPDDVRHASGGAWTSAVAGEKQVDNDEQVDNKEQVTGAALDYDARQWWHAFNDATLNALLTQALQKNLELRVASARVLEAQALRSGSRAQWWPQLDATLDVSRGKTVERNNTQTVAQAGVVASWELDLSGRLRHAASAAEADLQALQADQDALRLAVLAEVARNYIEYRLYAAQHALAQKNVGAQQSTVRITQARFREGMASRLDVERAQAQLFTTQAAVPQVEELREAARSRLALLTASSDESLGNVLPRGDVAADTAQPRTSPSAAAHANAMQVAIPAADAATVLLTPTQVLAQRADVRAAERRLVAAAARLRASGALRYPTLNLAAFLGVGSDEVGELFSGNDTRVWSASGGLLAPLFDFGRIRAQIDAADARQQQAYLAYEKTARTALAETQTAIVSYTQGVMRQRALEDAVSAARKAAELAQRNYTEGTLSLLDVLVAERSLYDSELAWSQATADVSLRLVALWQAMGVVPATPVVDAP